MSSFIKILPVGAELFHADRRTDMTKLTVSFHNFANAPKNIMTDGKGVHIISKNVSVRETRQETSLCTEHGHIRNVNALNVMILLVSSVGLNVAFGHSCACK